jgi:S1-C subfamily serine protease
MRHLILSTVLLMAAVTALPAQAGWSVKEHSTHDSLTWSDSNGHALSLTSRNGSGIEIAEFEPGATHGLEQGDVIVGINGHAVKHVSDLLESWSGNKRASAALLVRRHGTERTITMTAADFNELIHPHPQG